VPQPVAITEFDETAHPLWTQFGLVRSVSGVSVGIPTSAPLIILPIINPYFYYFNSADRIIAVIMTGMYDSDIRGGTHDVWKQS